MQEQAEVKIKIKTKIEIEIVDSVKVYIKECKIQ